MSEFVIPLPRKRLAMLLFNRATYSRMKALIDALSRYENIELTLGLSSALLWEEYGRAADYIKTSHPKVRCVELPIAKLQADHMGMALMGAEIGAKVATFLGSDYDGVIVIGDRYETLPAAMAAKYLDIPLIHIQGGEVTGNIDEYVRHSVTKLSDYHFPATDLAKRYVVALGEDYLRVHNHGCPSIDLIRKNRISRRMGRERYILSIFHPETDAADDAFVQTERTLLAVLEYCQRFQTKCYWYYPNPDPGREEIIRLLDRALDTFPRHFARAINEEPESFLRRLAGARLVVGNSSCGIRETSYLGIPSVNIGRRQNARERAENVVDVGLDQEAILRALKQQHLLYPYKKSSLYGNGRASEYIARTINTMDLEPKGPLRFPFDTQNRSKHFGNGRFKLQKKPRYDAYRDIRRARAQSRGLSGEFSGAQPSEPGGPQTHPGTPGSPRPDRPPA